MIEPYFLLLTNPDGSRVAVELSHIAAMTDDDEGTTLMLSGVPAFTVTEKRAAIQTQIDNRCWAIRQER